jgi:hypothetical protein
LPTALLALGLGRLLLSFLPPGRLGSHGLHELPRTLAVSFLLGLLIVRSYAAVFEMSPVPLALVCALLVFIRLATLPGAMVPPQQQPARTRQPAAALLLLAAVCLPWLVRGEVSSLRTLNALAASALVLLLDGALEEVAARAWLRRSALCALMLALVWLSPSAARQAMPWGALGWLAGTGLAAGWFLRADRRQGALAALALAFGGDLELRTNALLAAGALAILIACTAAPSRRWIATLSLVAYGLRLLLANGALANELPEGLAVLLLPALPALLLAIMLALRIRALQRRVLAAGI